MRAVARVVAAARSTGSRWSRSTGALWVAFGLAHGWLVLVGVVLIPKTAFYDLVLYRHWVAAGLHDGLWPVFDRPFVYPVGALIPMLVPAVLSRTSTAVYALGWCLVIAILNAIAVRELVRCGGVRSVWWWLTFLVLLGPVSMGRIDAIVAPVIIVALLTSARQPRVAAALVTACAWIKVAPGVIILPLLMTARRPVRHVVVPAALVCAGVIAAVAAGGGLQNLASFLTAQDSRGLQVEAVIASPWVVAALVRDDVTIVLNRPLSTWEIIGPGTRTAAHMLDLVLPLAVVGLSWLIWRARARPVDALVWGSLALGTLLIVVNKVGSPQYIGWLAPPIAVALTRHARFAAGLVTEASNVLITRLAGSVLVIAAATQLIFPLAYRLLLNGSAVITVVLVARNAGLVALLVVSMIQLTSRGVATRAPSVGVELRRVPEDVPTVNGSFVG